MAVSNTALLDVIQIKSESHCLKKLGYQLSDLLVHGRLLGR